MLRLFDIVDKRNAVVSCDETLRHRHTYEVLVASLRRTNVENQSRVKHDFESRESNKDLTLCRRWSGGTRNTIRWFHGSNDISNVQPSLVTCISRFCSIVEKTKWFHAVSPKQSRRMLMMEDSWPHVSPTGQQHTLCNCDCVVKHQGSIFAKG